MNLSPKNTQPSAVFLDANILIEIIQGRAKQASARAILQQHAGQLYISALTAHLVMHFGLERTTTLVLRQFLSDYTILPLEDGDFEWAFANMQGADYEDALQIAVATRNNHTSFITFDKSLVKRYTSKVHGLNIRLLP